MEKEYLQLLLKKHLENSLSSQEQLDLDAWYNSYARFGEPLRDEVAYQTVLKEMDNAFPFIPIKPVKKIKLWQRIATAAAVLTIIGGGLIYYNQKQDHVRPAAVYANDIAPGVSGATLTLANGKRIKLSDALNGELAQEAGVVITKSADGQLVYEVNGHGAEPDQINTLSTAKGESYQLRLPDGSMVWLNAASSLTYASSLKGKGLRRVKLQGEAYFEISKDKDHPFVVESKGQRVEVLGTHFNINSYADEAGTRTTLLEGSVKVSKGAESKMLKPGEQALLHGDRFVIARANLTEVMAWREGYFNFYNEDIRSIMRKVSRWYNVEVVYAGEIPVEGFNGAISKFKNVSKILEMLESTGSVRFKIEGRRIIVMR